MTAANILDVKICHRAKVCTPSENYQFITLRIHTIQQNIFMLDFHPMHEFLLTTSQCSQYVAHTISHCLFPRTLSFCVFISYITLSHYIYICVFLLSLTLSLSLPHLCLFFSVSRHLRPFSALPFPCSRFLSLHSCAVACSPHQ